MDGGSGTATLAFVMRRKVVAEYDWPAVDDESLLAALETWLCHI